MYYYEYDNVIHDEFKNLRRTFIMNKKEKFMRRVVMNICIIMMIVGVLLAIYKCDRYGSIPTYQPIEVDVSDSDNDIVIYDTSIPITDSVESIYGCYDTEYTATTTPEEIQSTEYVTNSDSVCTNITEDATGEIYTETTNTDEVPRVFVNKARTQPRPHIEDCTLSEDVQQYIYQTSSDFDVDYLLVMAIIKAESSYNPNATSGVAHGLMQIHNINKDYAKSMGVYNLYDQKGNVLVGISIISKLLEEYTYQDALTCYNMGEIGAQPYLGKGSNYSNKVLSYYYEYRNSI